jgi:hypothetical protein
VLTPSPLKQTLRDRAATEFPTSRALIVHTTPSRYIESPLFTFIVRLSEAWDDQVINSTSSFKYAFISNPANNTSDWCTKYCSHEAYFGLGTKTYPNER